MFEYDCNSLKLGADGQTICFKLSNYIPPPSLKNMSHGIRQLLIETGSMQLGQTIVSEIEKIVSLSQDVHKTSVQQRLMISVSSNCNIQSLNTRRQSQSQFSTEFDFFLIRFIRKELGQVSGSKPKYQWYEISVCDIL